MGSRCYQTRKKVLHIGHTLEIVTVVTYSFNPCVCVSQCSVHFSPSFIQHLRWSVLCVAEFSACSLRWPGSAPASCSDHVEIKWQKPSKSIKKRPSVLLAYKFVPFVKFPQQVDVISELFGPWSGRNCQLPLTRHARVFLQVYLSIHVCPMIAARTDGKGRPRILSSIAIGMMCCFCGSLSQFPLVIARSALASLLWHASSGKSSFPCEASILSCKSA